VVEKLKPKSAQNFSIKVWLQKVKLICTNRSRRKHVLLHHFSIKVCSKFFNQGLAEQYKSRSG
jgi:hypothetical protein